MKLATEDSPIVGLFFHSKEDGKISWQGQVVGSCGYGYYIVQLMSWIHGGESNMKVVQLSDMAADWDFFETAEEMRLAYDGAVGRGQ